jgi:hypothetical protein
MKLKVRIAPALKLESFRRCGLEFTREWTEIERDEATCARLLSEQMLETIRVSDTCEGVQQPAKGGAEKSAPPESGGNEEDDLVVVEPAPSKAKAKAKK